MCFSGAMNGGQLKENQGGVGCRTGFAFFPSLGMAGFSYS